MKNGPNFSFFLLLIILRSCSWGCDWLAGGKECCDWLGGGREFLALCAWLGVLV